MTIATFPRGDIIDVTSFGSLREVLGLTVPPFAPAYTFHQLDSIERHLAGLGCKTIVIESHYIDRDYIEDHSAFYSLNLESQPNSCRRLSFFDCEKPVLWERIKDGLDIIARADDGTSSYRQVCELLSADHFLGFMVVKPLKATPVGRTSILPTRLVDQGTFPSLARCKAHLFGLELNVNALPFQQQDVGVSACATTALWSSLQKFCEREEVTPASPAMITTLANEHRLPYGRSMPSEGLSTDQMCHAIRSVGAAPALIWLTTDYDETISFIHATTVSKCAPILILQDPSRRIGHAVTIAGITLDNTVMQSLPSGYSTYPQEGACATLFLHDDRNAPYMPVAVSPSKEGRLIVTFPAEYRVGNAAPEHWLATHLLLAVHKKIRLSFPGLRAVAEILRTKAMMALTTRRMNIPPATVTYFVDKSFDYLRRLTGSRHVFVDALVEFIGSVRLPRYIGVIRFSVADRWVDTLLDATSTDRNLNVLGVLSTLPDNTAVPIASTISELAGHQGEFGALSETAVGSPSVNAG